MEEYEVEEQIEEQEEYEQEEEYQEEEYSNEYDDEDEISDDEYDEEPLDDEIHEIILPDYVPDDLVPPDFDNEEEELAFYRENYAKAISLIESPELTDHIIEAYKDRLIAAENDHERFKAIKDAFDKDPATAMKFYFPEALEQRGYRTVIEGEQAEQWVSERMAEEFGEDYLDRYNADDAGLKPKSESAKMWALYEKTKSELAQHNERAKQIEDQSRPLSIEERNVIIEKQYEETFKEWLPKEQFENFLAEAEEKPLTLLDVYRAFNFNTFIDKAIEHGYVQGKKDAINGVRQSVRTTRVQAERPSQSQEPKRYENPAEMFHRLRSNY